MHSIKRKLALFTASAVLIALAPVGASSATIGNSVPMSVNTAAQLSDGGVVMTGRKHYRGRHFKGHRGWKRHGWKRHGWKRHGWRRHRHRHNYYWAAPFFAAPFYYGYGGYYHDGYSNSCYRECRYEHGPRYCRRYWRHYC